MTLLVHIVAGGLGLISGAVALAVAKGATPHRKSGMLFVYSMGTMSITGAVIAGLTGVEASVIAGLLTAYLVVTALTTVRPPARGARRLDLGAMVVGFAVGLTSLTLGLESLARGAFTRDGIPIPIFFVFGTVALLSGLGDVRMIRSGGIRGARRIARHLWRMCFALWIATASFFLGQADKFPDSLRHPAILVPPVLTVLVVMVYWLWRVRIRRTLRGLAGIGANEADLNDRPLTT
jgi:uncharacterized membrane protein